jgi:alkylation response protein AidB-like acyl-CoA dehydrogenase
VIRQKIAQISIELEAAQMLDYRTAWIVSSGGIPNYEASMRKMFITEAQQRMAHIATQIYGLYGQLRAGAPDTPLAGTLELAYRATVMPTFGGGASELMRNIIATRGMGLPRG